MIPPITRRRLMLGAVGVGAVAPLVGCVSSGEDVAGLSAWGGKVSDTMRFLQSVAWVEANEFYGRTAAMAFVPFEMDAAQRRAVVANGGVFPVLTEKAPMLEVRLFMAKPDNGQKMGIGTLRRLQLTFWNSDEPPPVVNIEKKDWTSTSDLQIDGLDGNFVAGGWIDGTIRGRSILPQGESHHDAYVWNLQVAMSLD